MGIASYAKRYQRDNKKRIYKIKEYKGNPANVLFAGFFYFPSKYKTAQKRMKKSV